MLVWDVAELAAQVGVLSEDCGDGERVAREEGCDEEQGEGEEGGERVGDGSVRAFGAMVWVGVMDGAGRLGVVGWVVFFLLMLLFLLVVVDWGG